MKINIENYDSMTPEEKLAALEAYDPEKDGFVSKSVFDKASSEAASYKKQLREKQSDEEAKAAKKAEKEAEKARKAAEKAAAKEAEKAAKLAKDLVTFYFAYGSETSANQFSK